MNSKNEASKLKKKFTDSLLKGKTSQFLKKKTEDLLKTETGKFLKKKTNNFLEGKNQQYLKPNEPQQMSLNRNDRKNIPVTEQRITGSEQELDNTQLNNQPQQDPIHILDDQILKDNIKTLFIYIIITIIFMLILFFIAIVTSFFSL